MICKVFKGGIKMKLLLSLLLTSLFIFPNNLDLNQEIEALNLSSDNYILYSMDSDQVVASKNEDKKIEAASIQKVLTTITAIDLLEGQDLNSEIVADPVVFNGIYSQASVAELKPNQTYRIIDILHAILLPSGADATRLISYHLTQDPEGLVKYMNQKAQEIGMDDTQIRNTTGLDMDGQYTTLNDLLKLVQYAIKNPTFAQIYATMDYTFTNGQETYEFENLILKEAVDNDFNYLKGAKSGYTTRAGFALSSIAEKDGIGFIFISTRAQVNFVQHTALMDAIKVYNYLFNTYKKETLPTSLLNHEIKVKNRLSPYTLESSDEISLMVPSNYDSDQLKITYQLSEDILKAPLSKDTLLGSREIYYGDRLLLSTQVNTYEDIPRDLFFTILNILLWIIIILAGLISTLFTVGKVRTHRHRKRMKY